jgi:predicted nuclease of restriction endonuclease-like (RecB) superfamily
MKTAKLKMVTPAAPIQATESARLYQRVREILESARSGVARTVNTTQVVANWLVGREIVEEEQNGSERADYGKKLVDSLSVMLTQNFGSGYSPQNLFYFKQFYLAYPSLLVATKILHAVRGKWPCPEPVVKLHAPRKESWTPGELHSNLSWTHYRTLLRVGDLQARAFYEIEVIKNNWTARELERQINSLLFVRLAKSKDKAGLMKLATKGQEIATTADVFKDPVVIEFLGLPESPRLVESDLEQALINNLQTFLLELGKGFAFVSRQERITLDGDHFYIDLVFYHAVLKCYVLIDLKVGKLTHGDLGQMQLYANYFDLERRTEGDNPTLGLILCTDKNDAVVKYLLGPELSKKIFTSRYKLHLPTEAELVTELKRETQALR